MAENVEQDNEKLILEKVQQGENTEEKHVEDVVNQMTLGKHDTMKCYLPQSIMKTFQNLTCPFQEIILLFRRVCRKTEWQ